MQMETHLVECKIDQSFDYLITAGGHSRREQQTHQQGTVSVRQANPNPSHIQAATTELSSAPSAMGHHRHYQRQLGCFSFSSPLPVMAAGRHQPGQWPGQQLHAGVLICGLLAAATLDRTSFHHTAEDARQLRGNMLQEHPGGAFPCSTRQMGAGRPRRAVRLAGEREWSDRARGTAAVGAGTWGCGRGGLGAVLRRSVSRAVISDAGAGITAVKKAIDLSKNIL